MMVLLLQIFVIGGGSEMQAVDEGAARAIKQFIAEFANVGNKTKLSLPNFESKHLKVIERLCLPFLRRVSLLEFCCLEKAKPQVTDTYNKSEFEFLREYLNLPPLQKMISNLWLMEFPYSSLWLQQLYSTQNMDK